MITKILFLLSESMRALFRAKLSAIISKVRDATIDGIVNGKSDEKKFILKLNKKLFYKNFN